MVASNPRSKMASSTTTTAADPPSSNPMTHCCCFTVRTGTLIQAWLGVALKVLILGFAIYVLANEGDIRREMERDESNPDSQMMAPHLKTIFTFLLVVVLVGLLLSGMLLVGVYKRISCLFLPYLVVNAVAIVLQSIRAFFNLMMIGIGPGLLSLVIFLPFLALAVYFWCCIYAHYKEVKLGLMPMDGASDRLEKGTSYQRM